jgi:Family of unknown function (DUF6055)
MIYEKQSPHFLIRYHLRNPPSGRGHGAEGVCDDTLIDTYLDALEQLYAVMKSPPWSRPDPIVGSEGKTVVKVLDTAELKIGARPPFTAADLGGAPYIYLLCGTDEPMAKGERLRAMADAVHEATHVFNWSERPLHGPNLTLDMRNDPWRWMHEAMAVYMETVVLKGNQDFHRFLRYWVTIPEIPLDTPKAGYQASMFLCYLAEKVGPEVINRIWTPPKMKETPLHAIERVLKQEGRIFVSPLPDDDVFASGYCMDSYFLQDPIAACHAKNVFQRHGGRAVSESFCLSADAATQTAEDGLDHLACRYYRFFLDGSITRLQVQLLADSRQGETTLKAEMAIVTKQMQRGRVYKLYPSRPSVTAEGFIHLSAEITEIVPGDIDHVVLVVSNCGFRGIEHYSEHDDGRLYRIKVTAY